MNALEKRKTSGPRIFVDDRAFSLSLSLSLSPEEKSGTFVTLVSLDDSYA